MPPRWTQPPPNLAARYAVADVTDHAALRDAIASLGPCDILVNNAGARDLQTVHETYAGRLPSHAGGEPAVRRHRLPGRAAGHARAKLRSHRQHRQHRRIERLCLCHRLCRGQARAGWLHPRPGAGNRARRHHRECGLPRIHRHRHGGARGGDDRGGRRTDASRKRARSWHQAIPPAGWCGRRRSPRPSPSCAGAMPAQ